MTFHLHQEMTKKKFNKKKKLFYNQTKHNLPYKDQKILRKQVKTFLIEEGGLLSEMSISYMYYWFK